MSGMCRAWVATLLRSLQSFPARTSIMGGSHAAVHVLYAAASVWYVLMSNSHMHAVTHKHVDCNQYSAHVCMQIHLQHTPYVPTAHNTYTRITHPPWSTCVIRCSTLDVQLLQQLLQQVCAAVAQSVLHGALQQLRRQCRSGGEHSSGSASFDDAAQRLELCLGPCSAAEKSLRQGL